MLLTQKGVITGEDINAVNDSEALKLAFGKINIWDEVRYIGIHVPGMYPEGVELRRALNLWDANRVEDADDSARDGNLPQYALTDRIEYSGQGLLGRPEIKIPFRFNPSQTEVEAVARSLSNFISQYTGEAQEVRDISGPSGIQYFVQDLNQPGRNPLLNSPNYRVMKDLFSMIEGAQGLVSIERGILCKHDAGTLEVYVQTVKPIGK